MPWIEQPNIEASKILHVARDKGQVMPNGGCCDLRIGCGRATAGATPVLHESPPDRSGRRVEWQDAPVELPGEFLFDRNCACVRTCDRPTQSRRCLSDANVSAGFVFRALGLDDRPGHFCDTPSPSPSEGSPGPARSGRCRCGQHVFGPCSLSRTIPSRPCRTNPEDHGCGRRNDQPRRLTIPQIFP